MTCWDKEFIENCRPSINFLELYGVAVSVLLWAKRYQNKRIVLFCDNTSVVNMINNTSSSCKNCMVLLRIIVLQSLIYNVRIYARYVASKSNIVADLLSRNKMKLFNVIAKNMDLEPDRTPIPDEIWPIQKIWLTK